jgi:hypothetical protein
MTDTDATGLPRREPYVEFLNEIREFCRSIRTNAEDAVISTASLQ